MQIGNAVVSIVILVHNAPDYAKHTLRTLQKTKTKMAYEVIVLDNASKLRTRKMLKRLEEKGWIDKLILSEENTLFSKGNNIAVRYMSETSRYILLLNSDIEIRNPKWLDELFRIHTKGVTALGCSSFQDNRPDGFCYLVDRELYEKIKLDESYAWFFSLAKLTAQILNMGYKVNTIVDYSNLLYHYGGKSGKVKNASGMDTLEEEVVSWFGGKKCTLHKKLEINDHNVEYKRYSVFNMKASFRLWVKPYRKKAKKILLKYLK